MQHSKKRFLSLIFCLGLLLPVASFSQSFQELSNEAGVIHFTYDPNLVAGGVAVFDFNNDGWDDFFVVGGMQQCQLFRNNGNGTFTDVSIQANLAITKNFYTIGVTTGDIDNDGYREILITTGNGYKNILLYNDHNGGFYNITDDAGVAATVGNKSATFGDINNDGWLDIVIGSDSSTVNNKVYFNNKNRKFTEKSSSFKLNVTGKIISPVLSDFDNDNDVDLIEVNAYHSSYGNIVMKNMNPVDTFGNVSSASGLNAKINGHGIAVGDYDNDGDFDYFISNKDTNMLMTNQGNGTFVNNASARGLVIPPVNLQENQGNISPNSWGATFADYDNDGKLDLFVANGWYADNTTKSDPNKLFKQNTADNNFVDVSAAAGFNNKLRGRGLAAIDYDNDGDMDIILNNVAIDSLRNDSTRIYKNTNSNGKKWLKVKVQGSYANRDGFGAKVIAWRKGNMQMREIDGGSSYQSQNTSYAHFGMDTNSVVDSLIIIWPKGDKRKFTNVATNQVFNVKQQYFTTVYDTICQFRQFGQILPKRIITKDTTFTDLVIANNGADSIVTNVIKMKPAVQKLNSVLLCKGAAYNGKNYLKDTLFTTTYPAYSGCDSLVQTSITILQPKNGTKSQNVCKGTIYNGKVYNANGTTTEIYKANNGCDSIVLVNIFVINTSSYSKDSTMCYGSKYDGQTYYTSQKVVSKLTNSLGCDSTFTINLNVKSQKLFIRDTIVKWGDTYAGKKWVDNGNISFNYVAKDGCDSVMIVKVTVDLTSVDGGYNFANFDLKATPNPTSQNANISFNLNNESKVKLTIVDITGNNISTIYNDKLSAGTHSFNWDSEAIGKSLSSGTYLCKLEVDNYVQIIKLIINR